MAAVLLAAFVVIERRAGSPLVPFSIFRLTTLRAANLTMLLTGAAVLSLFFILSLYEQQVLRYSALQAGLSQLPLAVTTIATAGLASRLVSRAGVKVHTRRRPGPVRRRAGLAGPGHRRPRRSRPGFSARRCWSAPDWGWRSCR